MAGTNLFRRPHDLWLAQDNPFRLTGAAGGVQTDLAHRLRRRSHVLLIFGVRNHVQQLLARKYLGRSADKAGGVLALLYDEQVGRVAAGEGRLLAIGRVRCKRNKGMTAAESGQPYQRSGSATRQGHSDAARAWAENAL